MSSNKIITCAEDKDGNITWYLNNEPFEATNLDKVNYYIHLYDYAYCEFLDFFRDIVEHPDFAFPDESTKDNVLRKGEKCLTFTNAARNGLYEIYPFEKDFEESKKPIFRSKKPVKSFLQKIISKLTCNHRWNMIFEGKYKDNETLTGAKITYCCAKCGKLKTVKY